MEQKYQFSRGPLDSSEVLKLLWALFVQSRKNGFVVIENIRPSYPVRARDGLEIALIYGAIDEPPLERILSTICTQTRWKIELEDCDISVTGCSPAFACVFRQLLELHTARTLRRNKLVDRFLSAFRQLGTGLNIAALAGLGIQWLELVEISAIVVSVAFNSWLITIPLVVWTVARQIAAKLYPGFENSKIPG